MIGFLIMLHRKHFPGIPLSGGYFGNSNCCPPCIRYWAEFSAFKPVVANG